MCSLDYGVVKPRLSQSNMKHASTRELFDYWNRRRGRRLVAARSDIVPTDIRDVLPDAFMLSADFTDEIRFRLAGTRVCALFARELKGESFKSLWANTSQDQIDSILRCVTDENEVLVAGVLGRSEDGAEVELELLLLPLARHEILNLPEDHRHDRFTPRKTVARLVLPNGTNVACRVIDLSQPGAAIGVTPDLRPPSASL